MVSILYATRSKKLYEWGPVKWAHILGGLVSLNCLLLFSPYCFFLQSPIIYMYSRERRYFCDSYIYRREWGERTKLEGVLQYLTPVLARGCWVLGLERREAWARGCCREGEAWARGSSFWARWCLCMVRFQSCFHLSLNTSSRERE